jgi:hypothetical protein
MSFIASRHIVPLNREKVAIDLNGVGTAWTGSTTFTLSGAAAAGSSITTKIVNSGTNARLVLTVGGTAGTLTIGDGSSTLNLTAKTLARWPSKAWVPGF